VNSQVIFPTPYYIIATIFFAIQIYCDFSAYTDIAIGTAQVFGIRLSDNFRRPYFSRSIQEFWRRWHITLSSWARDYVYIPLGGNRVRVPRMYFNIMIVFLVIGIWHGPSWTFIAWGALHGFYMISSRFTRGFRGQLARKSGIDRFPRIHEGIKMAVTFGLVCFAWIFFKASSVSDAIFMVRNIISDSIFGLFGIFHPYYQNWLFNNLSYTYSIINSGENLVAICMIIFMGAVELLQGRGDDRHLLSNRPIWLRWAVYEILLLSILFLGVSKMIPFIYFEY